MASIDWPASETPASALEVVSASLGGLDGGGTAVTYLMRGWGTVSSKYVYWIGLAPDDTGAPEVVTDPVLIKEIH